MSLKPGLGSRSSVHGSLTNGHGGLAMCQKVARSIGQTFCRISVEPYIYIYGNPLFVALPSGGPECGRDGYQVLFHKKAASALIVRVAFSPGASVFLYQTASSRVHPLTKIPGI